MRYQSGIDRDQVFMTSLDQQVADDSWARIVDFFVDVMRIEQFEFTHSTLNEQGNIPYHPSDLFKLVLYGYRRRLRSSPRLARSCRINVEVMWLMRGMRPSARTINYFRANNTRAIKRAHRHFVGLLKKGNLIEGKTLVQDGTKIRAQNSKHNNFTEKKIKNHLKWIDGNIGKYLDKLAEKRNKSKGTESDVEQIQGLEEELSKQQARKKKYEELKQEVENSPDGQVSKTDPDARAVRSSRGGVHIGYNIQGLVDCKHNLIVDIYCGKVNDAHELGEGARRAKEKLKSDEFDLLADSGYYTGSEMMQCEKLNVSTYVTPPKTRTTRKDGYSKSDFTYHAESDTYTCPENQLLATDGKIHNKTDREDVKLYKCAACKQCPQWTICCPDGRMRAIERSVYQTYKDENDQRVKENPQYHKWRTHIEHIFGTVKRPWDLSYTLVRGREKVENEYRLAAICYNLTRVVSILGMERFKDELEKLIFFLMEHLLLHGICDLLKLHPASCPFSQPQIEKISVLAYKQLSLQRVIA